jgi:dethiobiotin synthetase
MNSAGVLVLGSGTRCGKTVVTAGIAAALTESGFRVHALKPLSFVSGSSPVYSDQLYLNQITRQFSTDDPIMVASPLDVTPLLWNRVIDACRTSPFPLLVEGPGQVSTPWRINARQEVTDATDVAVLLGFPVLLVASAGTPFVAQTRLSLDWLYARQIEVIGFVRVCSASAEEVDGIAPDTMDPLLVSRLCGTPFLGDLPYSASISVSSGQQGNLIRLVETQIDLLPIQQGMGLTVPI